MAIKHIFVSTKEDGEDTTLVRPRNWNAVHKVDDQVANDMLYFDGTNWTRATTTTIRTLINVEDGSTADQTEAEIEAMIDTLANLTSVQGHTFTLTGNFIRSGAHSLTLVTTGATNITLPTTGTLDASTASRLSSKADYESRAMNAASGDVSYTGYGFQPKALVAHAVLNTGIGMSWGVADSSLDEEAIYLYATDDMRASLAGFVDVRETNIKYQTAILKTLDADGFTLTWTKGGTPASATAYIIILALR